MVSRISEPSTVTNWWSLDFLHGETRPRLVSAPGRWTPSLGGAALSHGIFLGRKRGQSALQQISWDGSTFEKNTRSVKKNIGNTWTHSGSIFDCYVSLLEGIYNVPKKESMNHIPDVSFQKLYYLCTKVAFCILSIPNSTNCMRRVGGFR